MAPMALLESRDRGVLGSLLQFNCAYFAVMAVLTISEP
jgi:hypothetical protein